MFILSGNDLTAEEFRNLIKSSDNWKSELVSKPVSFKEISEANHTFSSQKWRREVEDMTLDWLKNVL